MNRQVRQALIIEDYQAAAETFKELLEMLGCEANYVMAGAEAPQALSQRDYDVVFMDLNLPDIPGVALVKQLRALAAGRMPKFVAVSGYAEAELGKEASDLFDFYLEKPLDMNNLERILQSF
ncbi:response regulator [Methylobacillus sp. Pita2]|uniref:response regulator n=1 Tax=Methylobacillus sp. Pita2 TaxID=3383245 RepID=UPI0038B6551B